MSERQFREVATAEVARARRYGNPLSCLVIDVDHNGGNAHEPSALQQFVSVCKSTLRASDYIGRIGDEQFAVMLPETALLSALGAAERILANLAMSAAGRFRHDLAAGTSIGVAEYDDRTWSLDQFLKAAGVAMVDAIQNGRNQAVCYLDDLQLTSDNAIIN